MVLYLVPHIMLRLKILGSTVGIYPILPLFQVQFEVGYVQTITLSF